jgi:hypothetical protein
MEAFKIIGLFWVAMVVTYGIIAVALILGRLLIRAVKWGFGLIGKKRAQMSQFYVTDKQSADRARESVVSGKPVTMSGTIHDKVGFFTGPVQSVEELSPGKWRITIRDGK